MMVWPSKAVKLSYLNALMAPSQRYTIHKFIGGCKVSCINVMTVWTNLEVVEYAGSHDSVHHSPGSALTHLTFQSEWM